MDHAVYPIERIRAAFALALAWSPDPDTAIEFVARELGITVKTVRDALAISEEVPHA